MELSVCLPICLSVCLQSSFLFLFNCRYHTILISLSLSTSMIILFSIYHSLINLLLGSPILSDSLRTSTQFSLALLSHFPVIISTFLSLFLSVFCSFIVHLLPLSFILNATYISHTLFCFTMYSKLFDQIEDIIKWTKIFISMKAKSMF